MRWYRQYFAILAICGTTKPQHVTLCTIMFQTYMQQFVMHRKHPSAPPLLPANLSTANNTTFTTHHFNPSTPHHIYTRHHRSLLGHTTTKHSYFPKRLQYSPQTTRRYSHSPYTTFTSGETFILCGGRSYWITQLTTPVIESTSEASVLRGGRSCLIT